MTRLDSGRTRHITSAGGNAFLAYRLPGLGARRTLAVVLVLVITHKSFGQVGEPENSVIRPQNRRIFLAFWLRVNPSLEIWVITKADLR